MANTAPGSYNGFQQYSGTGSAPTYEQVAVQIAYNASPILYGDPVNPDANGYVVVGVTTGASANTQIAGVFVGCKYLSVSQKRTVWSNYWPGSDAGTNDVTAYITTDPNAQFIVQTGNSNTTATAVGLANVGQNISFNYNDSTATGETNGNTATGLSTMFADQYSLIANSSAGATTNAYLPFRIVSLANYTPGAVSPLATINGNDSTSAYNRIVVGFNNSMPRGFAGI